MPSGDEITMEVMEEPSQDQDGLAGDVENTGVSDGEQSHESGAADETSANERQSDATLAVQKRLKAQRRAHEREVRELHSRISDMESRMTQPSMAQQPAVNPYSAAPQGHGIDDQIHKAVSYALNYRDAEERKAHEAQQAAHVNRQYQELHKHLDSMNDKYDDFHEVVFGSDTPYTSSMRDYSMTLPKSGSGSAGEVLYKLGKNPE